MIFLMDTPLGTAYTVMSKVDTYCPMNLYKYTICIQIKY